MHGDGTLNFSSKTCNLEKNSKHTFFGEQISCWERVVILEMHLLFYKIWAFSLFGIISYQLMMLWITVGFTIVTVFIQTSLFKSIVFPEGVVYGRDCWIAVKYS